MKSYLTNRCQLVDIGGVKSELKSIVHGVPQGSILGPLFFVVYINDLYYHLLPDKSLLFADDTTLLSSAKNTEAAMAASRSLLQRAEKWFAANKLKLNEDKTKRIIFSPSDDVAGCAKLLGVVVDGSLRWRDHVGCLCRRLSTAIFMLRRLKQTLDTEALLGAYYAFFNSQLSYGVALWGNSSDALRVFVLQKKAVRIICGAGYRDHCRPLFQNLKILTLPSMLIYYSLLEMHASSDSYARNSDFCYDTRLADNLRPRRYRLTVSVKNSLNFAFFNRLPQSVRVLPRHAFKHMVKKMLLCHSFYSINEYLESTLDVSSGD